MASNYPAALDSLSNPASGDALSTGHAAQHGNVNDAVEAIEGELGTDPAGASATVKARFEAIEANSWVTSARIADGTITGTDIASGTVTSANLVDGTIVNADVSGTAAIDKTKISGTAVTVADTGTVTSTMIADGTITGTDIASGTVTSANLLDATIATADLAAGAVTPIKQSAGYVAKTALYTPTNDDRVIDCTSGTYTITLPTAVSQSGRTFIIRNSGTGTITIGRTGAETIAGATTQTLAGYGFIEVVSDGANWLVLRGAYTNETVGRRIFTFDNVNQRFQMTYGDTGWRDVTATINATHLTENPNAILFLRRVGNVVEFRYSQGASGTTTGSAKTIYPILTGWRTDASLLGSGCAFPTYNPASGAFLAEGIYYGFGSAALLTASWTAARHSGSGTYTSENVWPTSLPGTAVGSIPS